uniref:Uncharacterized protein n=1 Tax=Arundo donax TaxID=35708 RepID=A0A0A9DG97_ARUDO
MHSYGHTILLFVTGKNLERSCRLNQQTEAAALLLVLSLHHHSPKKHKFNCRHTFFSKIPRPDS